MSKKTIRCTLKIPFPKATVPCLNNGMEIEHPDETLLGFTQPYKI
jgi:hypothetical protein